MAYEEQMIHVLQISKVPECNLPACFYEFQSTTVPYMQVDSQYMNEHIWLHATYFLFDIKYKGSKNNFTFWNIL